MYITALSGLFLRSAPTQTAPSIILIPFKAAVIPISDPEAKEQTVDGITGRWVEVQYLKHSGYVFNAFLSIYTFEKEISRSFSPDNEAFYLVEGTASNEKECTNGFLHPCTLNIFKNGRLVLRKEGVGPESWDVENALHFGWIMGECGFLEKQEYTYNTHSLTIIEDSFLHEQEPNDCENVSAKSIDSGDYTYTFCSLSECTTLGASKGLMNILDGRTENPGHKFISLPYKKFHHAYFDWDHNIFKFERDSTTQCFSVIEKRLIDCP